MTHPRAPLQRPLLPPALSRVWRGHDRLQLGAGTRHPVVLSGVDPRDADFLASLDGRRDRTAALGHAASLGLTHSRAERLLDLLDSGHCLADAATDAHALAALTPEDRDRLAPDVAALSLVEPVRSRGLTAFTRRRVATVEVYGAGRVGAAVTALLAASGVGTVVVVDDAAVRPEDLAPLGPHLGSVGQPRSDAALAAARRTAPGVLRDPVGPPDVVVLTGAPVVDPALADSLLGRGIPHLPVTLLETTATIGPLVTPQAGPCLRCLDLHRCDRDPEWPLVAAQLGHVSGSRRGSSRPLTEACDVALASCAAALASLMVLAWLSAPDHDAVTEETGDGEQTHTVGVEPGTAYVLRLPGGQPRRRTYAQHPRCGCAWGGRQ